MYFLSSFYPLKVRLICYGHILITREIHGSFENLISYVLLLMSGSENFLTEINSNTLACSLLIAHSRTSNGYMLYRSFPRRFGFIVTVIIQSAIGCDVNICHVAVCVCDLLLWKSNVSQRCKLAVDQPKVHVDKLGECICVILSLCVCTILESKCIYVWNIVGNCEKLVKWDVWII